MPCTLFCYREHKCIVHKLQSSRNYYSFFSILTLAKVGYLSRFFFLIDVLLCLDLHVDHLVGLISFRFNLACRGTQLSISPPPRSLRLVTLIVGICCFEWGHDPANNQFTCSKTWLSLVMCKTSLVSGNLKATATSHTVHKMWKVSLQAVQAWSFLPLCSSLPLSSEAQHQKLWAVQAWGDAGLYVCLLGCVLKQTGDEITWLTKVLHGLISSSQCHTLKIVQVHLLMSSKKCTRRNCHTRWFICNR